MPSPTTRLDHAELATVRRFDVGAGGDLLKVVRRDSDGSMLLEGVPVREGILIYRNADGTERRELVTAQAVKDTVVGAARATVTLHHPVNDAGEAEFVSPDNIQKHLVGDVGERPKVVVEEEPILGGYGVLQIVARRRDALDAIESESAVELSPGYEVELDNTPGVHEVWGRYDAIQVARPVVNHLAIVPRGRGGPTVRLRTDSADAVQIGRATRTDSTPEAHMKPNLSALLTLLGVERLDDEGAAIQAGTAAVKTLQTAAAKRADADGDLEALKEENAKLKADLKASKDKQDEMSAEMEKMAKDKQDRADAAELADLQALATKVAVKHDGLKLADLRLAIAKTRVDSLDGKSPEYIAAVIDLVRADAAKESTDPSRWQFQRRDAGDRKFPPSYLDHADAALKSAGGAQ